MVAAIAARHAERARRAGRRSVLVGLVGRGIGSSRSPLMHHLEGERLGLAYDYALLDLDVLRLADDMLGDVVLAAEAAGFAGLNITHPFKHQIRDILTGLSAEAAEIGAVNTVVFGVGGRIGHNTDGWGFATSFRDEFPDAARDVVALVGAGGGGAAVAHALLGLGVGELRITDSDLARAEALAERLGRGGAGRVVVTESAGEAVTGASGVVNATPVGMPKYPGTPFDTALLRPGQWVADIVYFPEDTELLRRAREIGCRTLTGRGMAVFQAARAFELFTGVAADREAMGRHFEAATTEATASSP